MAFQIGYDFTVKYFCDIQEIRKIDGASEITSPILWKRLDFVLSQQQAMHIDQSA